MGLYLMWMCWLNSLMCPAKKSPWGPRWTSGREGSISPTLSGAGHAGTFSTYKFEYFFRKISIHVLHLQLFCLSAFCWYSDLGVSYSNTCMHAYPWYSINKSYSLLFVICWNAWVYCLKLLWQKDCGLTVWALLWQSASALPLKVGFTEHCAG